MKLNRFIRDIPKYENQEQANLNWLKENNMEGRDTIEDVINMPRKNFTTGDHYAEYQPALYEIVKSPAAM